MLEACGLEEFESFSIPILKLEEALEIRVGEFQSQKRQRSSSGQILPLNTWGSKRPGRWGVVPSAGAETDARLTVLKCLFFPRRSSRFQLLWCSLESGVQKSKCPPQSFFGIILLNLISASFEILISQECLILITHGGRKLGSGVQWLPEVKLSESHQHTSSFSLCFIS